MSYFKSIKDLFLSLFCINYGTTSFHCHKSTITFEPGAFHVNTSTDGGDTDRKIFWISD